MSTTDLDEAPGLHLLLPPIPEPVPGDEPLAGRGHPGGPGFTPEGSPAGVKTALKCLDICGDTVRLPLVQVSPKLAEKIVSETQKLVSQVTTH